MPDSPEFWRGAAFAKAWDLAGQREVGRDCTPVREVTLLASETLDCAELVHTLAKVRALAGDPVVRLARRAAEPPATINALAECAAGIEEPPYLHLVLNGGVPLQGAWERTLGVLADGGWPLAAEIWLERADGTEIESLRDLLRRLLGLRVRPYYLVDGEWLPMERRLAEADAVALVKGLRGWISGVAVPQLVREDRRGRREPIVPNYIESLGAGRVTLRNFRGHVHEYLNPGEKRG